MLLLAAITPSFAQTVTQQVQWSTNPRREPLNVVQGANRVDLCGLETGKSYRLYAVARAKGQQASFQLELNDDTADAAAGKHPGRPYVRQFVATGPCVELVITANSQENGTDVPMFLSMVCDDCPKTNGDWLKKFKSETESMVGIAAGGGGSASALISGTLIGGNCFDVSNVTSQGNGQSRGTFTNGLSTIGIQTGMVMATGNPGFVNGANTIQNADAGFGTNSADDPDLGAIDGGDQFDLSVIEFDFKPTATTVQFDFVFGSEEYCEFVNTTFNDLFGFFIDGPGLSANIAVIPGTGIPITINSVNHIANSGYYVNNNTWSPCTGIPAFNPAECQLDGWTTVISAVADGLTPCSTYHIKLAIADVADAIYGSAVFLKANSFDAGGLVRANPIYPGGGTFVYEGCGQGFIRFFRGSGGNTEPLTINYTLSGASTATPGEDYEALPASGSITIPAGQNEIIIPVNVFDDLIIEGDETIILLLDNPCSCTQDEVTFVIRDIAPIEITLDDQVACGAGGVTLTPAVNGGQPGFIYNWSNGSHAPSVTVTQPGTHTFTVTITDACNNSNTATATATIQPAPTATLSGGAQFCAGSTQPVDLNIALTGVAPWDVEVNGPTGVQTYNFTSSPGTITVDQPGIYTLVSVQTVDGCPGTTAGTVNITEVTVSATLNPTDPGCAGSNNGSITVSPSGGNVPYSYIWSNGSTSGNQSNLPPGSYTVTVTDNNGCTDVVSADLTEPPPLVSTITASENIDCNNPQGGATLEVDGGTPGYTFLWNNGSTQQNPVFNNGGTYTVTVRDQHNCTSTATVQITQNTTPPVTVIAPPQQLTCNTTTLTLNANGSSQGPNFQMTWSGPGFVCCDNTLQPQIDQGGAYILTIVNTDNGCTAIAGVQVIENNQPPAVSANAPTDISCVSPNVQVTGQGSAVGAGITYLWTTTNGNIQSGQNSMNAIVNQAGTYTLLVTNTITGCTAEESVDVVGNTIPPVASASPPQVITCLLPEVTIDGSGSSQGPEFDYQWTTNTGNIVGGANTLNPTVDEAGVYQLVVTNTSNQCTAITSVSVTANNAPPNATATAPFDIDCQHTSVTINGVGSSTGATITYSWTSPDGNFVGSTNGLNAVVDQGGTYTLLVTNTANGCTDEVEVIIEEDLNAPFVDAGLDRILNCYDLQPQLDASADSGPGISYQWTATNGGHILSGGTTLVPTIDHSGTYTLLVTNSNNGCTSTDVVDVTANLTTPNSVVAQPGMLTCLVTQITLNGSGSTQGSDILYEWITSSGTFSGPTDQASTTTASPGIYTLIVTNMESGCTDEASVTVAQNNTPANAVAAGNGAIDCQTPTVIINGTGSSTGPNVTYTWTTPDGNFVGASNGISVVVNEGGTYTLVVSNTVSGCTDAAVVTISQNQTLPFVDAGLNGLLNCYDLTPQLNAQAESGAIYSYQWTASNGGNIVTGATSLNPTVDAAGTYTLVVTNTTNGCSSSDAVVVAANLDTPDAQVAAPPTLTCLLTSVDLNGSGSSQGASIQYQWTTSDGNITGGAGGASTTADAPGTYTLLVTNSISGCTDQAQVTVAQNTVLPTVSVGPGGEINCQISQITINATGSGGAGFTLDWQAPNGHIVSGQGTQTIVVDQAGTYTLLVTNDANGCTASGQALVTADANLPVADGGPDLQLDCQTAQVTFDGSASTTGPGYTYQWVANPGNIVSGASSLTPVVDQGGTYTLTLTNTLNGCTATDAVVVVDNILLPQAVIAPPGQLNCDFSSLQLDAGASTQGLNYQWTTSGGNIVGGANTLLPQIDQPGTYNLLITNTANFCTATASISVTEDVEAPVATAAALGQLTCQFPQVQLSGQGSSQGPAFSYQWTTTTGNIVTGGTSLNATVNQPGPYVLTVVNINNGCEAQTSITVTTNQAFPLANAGPAQTLTCSINEVTLNGAGSSQGPEYNYIWSTQGGVIVSGENSLNPVVGAPGTYTIAVVNTQSGCTSTANVQVGTDLAPPTVVVVPGGQLSCTVSAVTLSGAGSSTGGYSYLWTTQNGNIISGETTLSPVVNAVGQYTLIITSAQNGCTASANTEVTADAGLPDAQAGAPDTLTCVLLQTTLNGSASSQGSNFSYLWTGPGIVSGNTSLNPIVNLPGTYELIVTNTTNGCDALSTVTIGSDVQPPAVEAGPAGTLNCSELQLTLDGSASTQAPGLVYTWTASGGGNIVSGPNTLTPTIDQPGQYQLAIFNPANGCSATDMVTINQNVQPPVAAGGPDGLITCTETTVTLGGNGSSSGPAFTYQWTSPDGNIASGATTLTPVVDAPGAYNLVVTDTLNGCTATDLVQVNKDANVPEALAQVDGELTCVIDEIQLDGTASSQGPDITFQWTGPAGSFVSGQNTLTPTVNAPGQYTLTILNNSNNCTAVSTISVLENLAPPQADAGSPAVISCSNPLLTLDGSGSSQGAEYTYEWTSSNGNLVGGINTLSPQVDESGFYTIVVTNQQNGCTADATVQILLDINSPEADAGPGQFLTCVVSSLDLNGTGSSIGPNFVYQWTASAGGNIVGGADGLTPTINAPGTYTLLVSNPTNGCTSEESVQVVEDLAPPTASVAPPATLDCQLLQTGLEATTGTDYSYEWTTSNGNIVQGDASPNPLVNEPGSYDLLVTNNINGCTATTTVTVAEDVLLPVVNAGPTATLTCTEPTADLAATVTSAGTGYEIVWSTTNGNIVSGQGTLNPTVDQAGTYTLTITNPANHCSATAGLTIATSQDLPVIAFAQPNQLTCAVSEVGLSAVGSSAGAQFEYTWTGPGLVSGANTLTPTVNQPGPYTLQIVNTTNSCVSEEIIEVAEDVQPPQAESNDGFEITCTLAQDQLSGAGSSTGLHFQYQWNTADGNILSGHQTLAPTVNAPGTYSLVVTNTQNGCTASDLVAVTENTNYPSDVELFTELPACGNQPGLVRFEEVMGGVGPYLYSIDGGENFFSANEFGNLAPGQYDLMIQDVNGCEYDETLTFPVPVEPQVTTTPEIDLHFGDSENLIATLNIPLSEVASITWSPMDGLTPTNLPNVMEARPFKTTQYEVTVINLDGCEDRALVLVNVDDPAIWAPNVISPHRADGVNDWFLIWSREGTVYKINSLQIFDRWGNEVFQAKDIQPNVEKLGWNGLFRGKPMDPAVFVWYAEVELVDGRKLLMKGDVTIVD